MTGLIDNRAPGLWGQATAMSGSDPGDSLLSCLQGQARPDTRRSLSSGTAYPPCSIGRPRDVMVSHGNLLHSGTCHLVETVHYLLSGSRCVLAFGWARRAGRAAPVRELLLSQG